MRLVREYYLDGPGLRFEFPMPAGAQVLGLHGRVLLALIDTNRDPEPHTFQLVETGLTVPQGAQYVGTAYSVEPPAAWHLFELVETLPDDIPVEHHCHYRELVGAGFTLRPDRAWLAPADVEPGHLTTEQVIAVATLQEHGYGPVVGGA